MKITTAKSDKMLGGIIGISWCAGTVSLNFGYWYITFWFYVGFWPISANFVQFSFFLKNLVINYPSNFFFYVVFECKETENLIDFSRFINRKIIIFDTRI